MSATKGLENTVELLQQQVRELQAELRQLKAERNTPPPVPTDTLVGRRRLLKKLAGLGMAGVIVGGSALAHPHTTEAAGESVMTVRGIFRAAGAGVGTSTCAFIHQTTAANILDNFTVIDHPHANNQHGAILLVTHNFNPPGQPGTYDNNVLGVFYKTAAPFTDRWCIYHEDTNNAMLANRYYNVLVIQP